MSDFYKNQIEQIPKTNNSNDRMLQEFKELINENHGFDFDIKYGELEVDNIIGGFSDGTYKLKGYDIDQIDSNSKIYSMKLLFKKSHYIKNVILTFHYTNGNEIIINYKGDFYKIHIGNKIEYIRKRIRNGIKTEIKGKRKPIKIDDLKLILQFKTD